MRFREKVVVITGGASGIGFAAAQQFAAEGALVVINDLHASQVEAAVERINQSGRRAFRIVGDVADPNAVRSNVREILAEHGRIDVLVNNAAVIMVEPAEAISLTNWNRVVAINLNGVFHWAQSVAAESMIPNRGGVIINVASIAGMVAGPYMASYIATKHAVVGLTKALAIEWGARGIRVNALCPGLTETELVKAKRAENPAMFEERERRIPLGRVATPEDQASAILYMASPSSSSVHGLIMNVDGGQLAMSSGYALPVPA